MRIRKPGKIGEHLWYLGCEESGVYLLEGQGESMIISGGMSYILPDVLKQMREFGVQEDRIRKLLILHAHFDHVGIVPFFKRRHPELQIYGSPRAWEILSMPKAINTINAFSGMVAAHRGRVEDCSGLDTEWREDVEGASVSEGDQIGIDHIEVQIFETPGHSSCSISAYVPQIKALFASDGGGIPYQDMIVTAGNSNRETPISPCFSRALKSSRIWMWNISVQIIMGILWKRRPEISFNRPSKRPRKTALSWRKRT
jgi:glyoxylase-like metal-dependent hydrolase (beta-lactamase superfamily II)